MIVKGVALGFVLPIVLPGTLPGTFRFGNDFCNPIKSTKEGWDRAAQIDQHVLVHHRLAIVADANRCRGRAVVSAMGNKTLGLKGPKQVVECRRILLTRGMDMNLMPQPIDFIDQPASKKEGVDLAFNLVEIDSCQPNLPSLSGLYGRGEAHYFTSGIASSLLTIQLGELWHLCSGLPT